MAIIKQYDKYNIYIRRHYTTVKTKQNTVSYHKQKKNKKIQHKYSCTYQH